MGGAGRGGTTRALHPQRRAEPLIFVLYASQRHAEVLQRANPDLVFELPLSGMSLYRRLRWYDDRLRIASRMLGLPVLRR